MALQITITPTSGVAATDVPEDIAEELQGVYEKLSELKSGNAANVDFDTRKEANIFVRQGKAWAEENGLVFARKGVVKDNPTRVSFRIYAPSTRGRKAEKK
jgi:hypothetical protein